MKSAIAYNREKYLKKSFDLKEGLVGRCAFEKLPVYLKEIPENYINLKSGLGGSEPRFLLLVPLIFNENVLGVIEIASFDEIPKYQIEFVQTLGENIASTISNVAINEQTKHLFGESNCVAMIFRPRKKNYARIWKTAATQEEQPQGT
jgi:transcriptional regulator with GAF, ATPase, and Fis domain